jgi:hypothetical protein
VPSPVLLLKDQPSVRSSAAWSSAVSKVNVFPQRCKQQNHVGTRGVHHGLLNAGRFPWGSGGQVRSEASENVRPLLGA